MTLQRRTSSQTTNFSKPTITNLSIIGYHKGAAIKLSDVANVQDSVQDIRAAAYFDEQTLRYHAGLSPAWRQHHRNG